MTKDFRDSKVAPVGRALRVLLGALLIVCVTPVYFRVPLILGRGQGELAAVTFLGISLLIAGWRGAPGCELMAIPDLFFAKHTNMPCLIFSPLDWLERKLRRK